MVLEAVMICIDNSEWMRNGDYSPTRFTAQTETADFLASAKIQGNQETDVGFLSMAGDRVQVHMTPSREIGKIMTALKNVKLDGKSNFVGGMKTAQLALKNRQNKNQRQRIIMFVGSPVKESEKELKKLGKNFRKNNVAVDVVNFGTENLENGNVEKLEVFVNAVNNNDTQPSHLVSVPPGPHILSDLILTSSIMMGSAPSSFSGSGQVGGSQAPSSGGGVDPNLDPELALALRMSMEEERQRQERLAKEKAEAKVEAKDASTGEIKTVEAEIKPSPMEEEDDEDDEDDEALLAQAIAMSMEIDQPDDENKETESKEEDKTEQKLEDGDLDEVMRDEEFLHSLLDSVPGIDKDELELDDIMNNLGNDDEDDIYDTDTEEKEKEK